MQLGRYEVIEELGRGAMGVVLRAVDGALGREVAIKLLRVRPDAGRLRRFQREARSLGRLRGSGIVTVHEVGEVDAQPYIVMELVRGESLERLLLRNGPLPPRRAADIARRVARALARAHAIDLIHRDVKPANILMMEDGAPVLTDFGLVKDLDPESASLSAITVEGAFVGTPGFAAPEQAAGAVDAIGPAVDVYALGATLYAMLTDDPPFRGSWTEIIASQLRAAPPPPSFEAPGDEGDALAAICLRCLDPQPERRWPSADALADALDAWLEGKPPMARPRRRARAAVLGSILGVAVVVGAILAIRGRGRPGAPPAPGPDGRASPASPTDASGSGELATAATLRERADARWKLGRFDDALADLDRLVSLEGPDEGLHLALRARRRRQRRDWTGAKADAAAARRARPDLALPLVEASRIATADFRPDESVALAEEAIAIAPDDAGAHAALASALHRSSFSAAARRAGRVDELREQALAAALKATTLDPTAAEPWVEHALVAITVDGARAPGRALASAARARELAPSESGTFQVTATAALLAGDGETVSRTLMAWREMAPDPALVEISEGLLLHRLTQTEVAFEAFDRARAAAPDPRIGLQELPHLLPLARGGDATAAARFLREAERAARDDPELLARCAEFAGVSEEMLLEFGRRIGAGASLAKVEESLTRGVSAALGADDIVEAERLLLEAASGEPPSAQASTDLARLYFDPKLSAAVGLNERTAPIQASQWIARSFEAIEATARYEWLPIALAFRAALHFNAERLEETRTDVELARSRLAGLFSIARLDDEARLILGKVEGPLRARLRERPREGRR